MTPSGPSFVSAPHGSFYFDPAFISTTTTSLSGALGDFYESMVVFDASGKKWSSSEVRTRRKKNWWSLLLANTINPKIAITVVWKEPTLYLIEDLKRAFSHAVDQDDDILTQFVEADELKEKISEAQSFDELVAVHQWMVTDHTDENRG